MEKFVDSIIEMSSQERAEVAKTLLKAKFDNFTPHKCYCGSIDLRFLLSSGCMIICANCGKHSRFFDDLSHFNSRNNALSDWNESNKKIIEKIDVNLGSGYLSLENGKLIFSPIHAMSVFKNYWNMEKTMVNLNIDFEIID